ncbi:GspH/FimT family pseudopilin [Noviherbaspirillum sp. ST9]|uniref:GspH/FimT family pseudopilin n=1 Tax=Noviherbaspirillum sp. ST9 TaxID=3401606 RepID=UPI003B586387
MRHHCQTAESASAPAGQRGFTLVELMVTLAVVAVLLGIALPGFNNATLGTKLSTYANSLVASANMARSEAIKRNAAVTMCVSTDGATCTGGSWEEGWIVLAGTDVIVRQNAASTGFKLTGTASTLTFQATGVGATVATITACRALPSVGGQERVVNISATGRTSTAKTYTGVCS